MKQAIPMCFSALILILFVSACSDDSIDVDTSPSPLTGNYFPSANTNIWNYDVDNTNAANPEQNFENEPDFVSIATASEGVFTLEINNGGLANGAMNGILAVGVLNTDSSTLSYSGNLQLPGGFSDLSDQVIVLQDVLLYDLNASNGSLMSELTDSFTENLDLNGTMVPLTINYQLQTRKISTSNSMSVNGETYSNIIKTELVLNLNVYATIDLLGGNNPSNYDIIDNQDVLVIENYFAEDIGLIKSEAEQTYQIEEDFVDLLNFLSVDLGVPTSQSILNVQELDSYLLD